jgi:ATP-binding cassette subfamily C (CFTR/MRP) protein 1
MTLTRHFSKKLWKALMEAYGSTYAFAAFLKVIQDCLSFLQVSVPER